MIAYRETVTVHLSFSRGRAPAASALKSTARPVDQHFVAWDRRVARRR